MSNEKDTTGRDAGRSCVELGPWPGSCAAPSARDRTITEDLISLMAFDRRLMAMTAALTDSYMESNERGREDLAMRFWLMNPDLAATRDSLPI